MSHLFQTYQARIVKKTGKRIFILDSKGQKIPHDKWRFQYTDWQGKRRKQTGYSSRKDTEKLAYKTQAYHDEIRKGYRPPPNRADKNAKRPFWEVAQEYLDWGDSQGGHGGRPWGRGHSRMRRSQLKWWQKHLGLETLMDLKGVLPRAESALREKLKAGNTGATVDRYRETLSAFCKWAVERGYLDENPLKRLGRFDITPQIQRRALTLDEIRRLFEVADEERQLLYLMAICTGLRAGELAALRVYDLNLDFKAINLRPEITKNRKPGRQPVPYILFERLVEHIQRKEPEDALLNVPSHPARRLKIDLDAAGIPKFVIGQGKVDFHSLRVTYTTLVIEAGANIKEAQTLARHSDPKLTLNIYAKTRNERLSEIADKVGNSLPFNLASTGAQTELIQNHQEALTIDHASNQNFRK